MSFLTQATAFLFLASFLLAGLLLRGRAHK
jgi:hypothetical protein